MVSPGQNDLSSDKSRIDPYVKKQNAKLTQVIQNFFSKSVQIVLQSRIQSDLYNKEEHEGDTSSHSTSSRINKWFNLHMSNLIREDLKLWKSTTSSSQIPPMIIETYLDLRQLTPRQSVVLRDYNGNPWTVAKGGSKKHEVVLERWLIEFDGNSVSGSIVDELPLIYKQAIILFRSLYGYARLMPVYKLKKDLNKSNLTIGCKVLDGKQPISSKGRIGLSKSIIPHQMLTTESHMSHKHFTPIQTTLGTLKISIAYRIHHDFSIQDNEELLSTHFITFDDENSKEIENNPIYLDSKEELSVNRSEKLEEPENDDVHDADNESSHERLHSTEPDQSFDVDSKRHLGKKLSISNTASMSISPCSSGPHPLKEGSPSFKKGFTNTPPIVSQRPIINPFKVGSISSSPPPLANFGGSSLERKVSITSNKSASNASLAAMLRNPRGSTSSTNTTANIPIANNSNQYNSSFPRSVSSSHGSNLGPDHDNPLGYSNSDNTSNAPRFSSSFGSRASRRFSNTSGRQNSLPTSSMNETSLLATSAGLTSSDAPASGLYIDDDIGDFVRMIDSKSDLRFSGYNSNNDSKFSNSQGSNSQIDALNKFQMLKNQHQQLSDSVSASLILHHNQISGSRPSSRKSSHSMHSPPPSLPSGSYDNSHLPSINSRLRENSVTSGDDGNGRNSQPPSSRKGSFDYASNNNATFLKGPNAAKLVSSPVTSTTTIHSNLHKTNKESGIISGLATTPSIYSNRRSIHYESVFDDDEDDYTNNEGGSRGQDDSMKLYLANKLTNPLKSNTNSRSFKSSSNPPNNGNDDDDDDDLLFTMSDMNLAKH